MAKQEPEETGKDEPEIIEDDDSFVQELQNHIQRCNKSFLMERDPTPLYESLPIAAMEIYNCALLVEKMKRLNSEELVISEDDIKLINDGFREEGNESNEPSLELDSVGRSLY